MRCTIPQKLIMTHTKHLKVGFLYIIKRHTSEQFTRHKDLANYNVQKQLSSTYIPYNVTYSFIYKRHIEIAAYYERLNYRNILPTS